jgi:hypothetical protein
MILLNSDMLLLLLSEEGKIVGINLRFEGGLVVELRWIWPVLKKEEKMKVVWRVMASRLLGKHPKSKLMYLI